MNPRDSTTQTDGASQPDLRAAEPREPIGMVYTPHRHLDDLGTRPATPDATQSAVSQSGPSLSSSSALFDILPHETISAIFLLGVHDEVAHGGNDGKFGDFALSASHVCQQWRSIALATPLLYNYIHMDAHGEAPPFPWTCMYLERSQECPLYIDLFWPEAGDSENENNDGRDEMAAALDILTPHIGRWRSLSLEVDGVWPIYQFVLRFHREDVSAPHALRSFSINHRKNILLQALQPFPIPPIMTSLKTLSLSRVHLNWSIFPFANLTDLELRHLPTQVQPTVASFTHMLELSPNLIGLTLIGVGPFALSEFDSQAKVTLPALTHLHISSFKVPAEVTLLAKMIVAPKLQSLTLANFSAVEDFSEAFSEFGSGNFRSVTELTLSKLQFANPVETFISMANMFIGLPRIHHLTFSKTSIEAFLCLLVPLRATTPHLPAKEWDRNPIIALPRLAIVQISSLQANPLLDFAERRKLHRKKISLLILTHGDPVLSEKMLKELEGMVEIVAFVDPQEDSDSDNSGDDEDWEGGSDGWDDDDAGSSDSGAEGDHED